LAPPQATAFCCTKTESAAVALSDKSLYQTESKWTTDTGKQIKLQDLKGRPQVVVMFFASCQSACPVLVHDLQRIETALNPEQRARVGFTLVTIDPRRDTPEALRKYRATRVLPAETWSLLRGEPDDIRELVALLGVKYLSRSLRWSRAAGKAHAPARPPREQRPVSQSSDQDEPRMMPAVEKG